MSNIDTVESPSDSGCSGLSPSQHGYFTVPPASSASSSTYAVTNPISTDSDSLVSPPSRTPTPGAKKRKTDDQNVELRSALVTALQEPISQPDGVDGMLARLGEGLRRLPYRERAALEIKFLTMLVDVEDRLNMS